MVSFLAACEVTRFPFKLPFSPLAFLPCSSLPPPSFPRSTLQNTPIPQVTPVQQQKFSQRGVCLQVKSLLSVALERPP